MADCSENGCSENGCSSTDGVDKSESCPVVYIHCAELMRESDKNPRVSGRVGEKSHDYSCVATTCACVISMLSMKIN